MEPWKLVHQRPGPSGYVKVVTCNYLLPDGKRTEWDLLADGDSVAVVAITSNSQVVLVRQYRPGPGRILDELPGGGIEEGEDPAEAAGRELLEETGYTGKVQIVGATWLAGHSMRRRWAALATDCQRQRSPAPDDGEFCEPFVMAMPDFRAHLRSGQLTNVDIGYMCLDHAGLL
jgi:ADP-ribose pyrophosphatase